MSGNNERRVILKKSPWIEDGKIVRCSKCGSRDLWKSACKTAAFCGEDDCGFLSYVNEVSQQHSEDRWDAELGEYRERE